MKLPQFHRSVYKSFLDAEEILERYFEIWILLVVSWSIIDNEVWRRGWLYPFDNSKCPRVPYIPLWTASQLNILISFHVYNRNILFKYIRWIDSVVIVKLKIVIIKYISEITPVYALWLQITKHND